MMELGVADTPTRISQVKQLFVEYFDMLKNNYAVDLGYQNIQAELDSLPGYYGPPHGLLYVALEDGAPAGCIAYRPMEPGACELKRMYVRPAYRRMGLGRILGEALIAAARQNGYSIMRLDTGSFLTNAIHLYQTLGFSIRAPYYDPPAGMADILVFMERAL